MNDESDNLEDSNEKKIAYFRNTLLVNARGKSRFIGSFCEKGLSFDRIGSCEHFLHYNCWTSLPHKEHLVLGEYGLSGGLASEFTRMITMEISSGIIPRDIESSLIWNILSKFCLEYEGPLAQQNKEYTEELLEVLCLSLYSLNISLSGTLEERNAVGERVNLCSILALSLLLSWIFETARIKSFFDNAHKAALAAEDSPCPNEEPAALAKGYGGLLYKGKATLSQKRYGLSNRRKQGKIRGQIYVWKDGRVAWYALDINSGSNGRILNKFTTASSFLENQWGRCESPYGVYNTIRFSPKGTTSEWKLSFPNRDKAKEFQATINLILQSRWSYLSYDYRL